MMRLRASPLLTYTAAVFGLIIAIAVAVRLMPATDPTKGEAAKAERVLAALAHASYDEFFAECDHGVRQLGPDVFHALAEQSGSRLKAGHEIALRDSHWRGDFHVSRWQVRLKDGGPDAVLTLGFRNGRVAMFSMR